MKVIITRYTPFSLTQVEKVELAEELHDLFNWFQPDSATDSILKMIAKNEETFVLVARQQNELAGFLIANYRRANNIKVFYLSGILVDASMWGQGIASQLLSEALKDIDDVEYLAAHTQNPTIYRLLQKQFGNQNVFPREHTIVSPEILQVAFAIDGDKVSSDLILKDTYGNLREDRTYLTQQTDSVGLFFQQHLGKNDAFFIIAKIR